MPLNDPKELFINSNAKTNHSLLVLIIAVCLMPLVLNFFGVDFSSPQRQIAIDDTINHQQNRDELFYALSGGLHHALMEWSAVMTALLAALISFFHYSVKRDITIPVIGMAMLSAGLVDAFHTLAATRIISANAPNVNFIPYTWALSRMFNGVIVIVGILICMWLTHQAKSAKSSNEQRQKMAGQIVKPSQFAVIILVSVIFLMSAYFLVHQAATKTDLPQTMYLKSLIKRPFDVIPLVLFFIGGWLAWVWYRQNHSVVRYALILSLIPEIAVQIYMAFGSTALFDNNFNIAHFLKIVAYSMVFFGLVYDLVHSLPIEIKKQQFAINQHAIVSVTDVEGTIQYVNEKFEQISGFSRRELLGNNHRILNSNTHPPEFFKNMNKVISSGNVWNAEICNQRKDGSLYWVDSTIVPFLNEAGKPYQFIYIRTDITNKKNNEKKLRDAKNEAIDAARSKSDFFASMSHEIRTPMNGVLGMLNLMIKTDLDTQQRHYAALAKSSADSLLTIINDILDLSKIQAGKIDLEMLDFDLRELMGSLAESMGYRAQDKGLEVILDLSGIEQSLVNGDPVRIRQILSNLIGNSIKFTQEGEILIRATLSKNQQGAETLSCIIEDTGIGIPADKIGNLFNTYSQVDSSTTRKFGGTGLGLAIVKELCQRMNGDVIVTSEYGTGTRFSFNIQLGMSKHSIEVKPERELAAISILIIDNNENNLKVLANQYEKWGATVCTATSGDRALTIVKNTQHKCFDLIIIDAEINDVNSIKLGQQLRDISSAKDARLVMMTSMAGSSAITQLKENFFSGYFPKPATTNDLFLALEVLNEPSNKADKNQHSKTDLQLITTHRFNNAKVLLAEDNAVNQEVAIGILADMGIKVVVANNGLEAIDLLKNAGHEFGLLLMDCQMPEMDGYEATRQIRLIEQRTNKKIAIVAMTANALKGDRQRCIDSGMDDYLTKPVDPNELEAKLRLWLPKSQQDHHQTTNRNQDDNKVQAKETSHLDADNTENIVNPEAMVIWDKAGLLKRVRNNHKLAKKLISLFLNDLPNLLSELNLSLKESRVVEVGDIAHRIKGSAANLSGLKLSALAGEIEASARAEKLDFVTSKMDEFSHEIKLLTTELKKFSELMEPNSQ